MAVRVVEKDMAVKRVWQVSEYTCDRCSKTVEVPVGEAPHALLKGWAVFYGMGVSAIMASEVAEMHFCPDDAPAAMKAAKG